MQTVFDTLIDPGAFMIVVAGTLLAATARCGWRDVRAALVTIASLRSVAFDPDANRAALARTIAEVQERGHLCAERPLPPDASIGAVVRQYLVTGSMDVLQLGARAERAKREIIRAQAVRVFDYAGEVAPVFGLVGTLFAISQLAPTTGANAAETTMASVATAVLSSLYGVLTAHIIYIPVASAIDRRGEREETARGALIDWFEKELKDEKSRPNVTGLKDAA